MPWPTPSVPTLRSPSAKPMPPIAWPLLLAWGCHVSPTHHPCPLINSQVEGYAFAMSAATLATTRFRISWATFSVCTTATAWRCSATRCPPMMVPSGGNALKQAPSTSSMPPPGAQGRLQRASVLMALMWLSTSTATPAVPGMRSLRSCQPQCRYHIWAFRPLPAHHSCRGWSTTQWWHLLSAVTATASPWPSCRTATLLTTTSKHTPNCWRRRPWQRRRRRTCPAGNTSCSREAALQTGTEQPHHPLQEWPPRLRLNRQVYLQMVGTGTWQRCITPHLRQAKWPLPRHPPPPRAPLWVCRKTVWSTAVAISFTSTTPTRLPPGQPF
mmetsp:Transcript_5469/g.14776  ORF Transcript_5469/g.14776 Transcript_5469/m.14776 type:complete len:327 (-) Transcript_5469:1343-2323(-)